MKRLAFLLCLLVLGGCVSKDGGSEIEASTSSGNARGEQESRAPRQMCENTSIAGQPKSFCY